MSDKFSRNEVVQLFESQRVESFLCPTADWKWELDVADVKETLL